MLTDRRLQIHACLRVVAALSPPQSRLESLLARALCYEIVLRAASQPTEAGQLPLHRAWALVSRLRLMSDPVPMLKAVSIDVRQTRIDRINAARVERFLFANHTKRITLQSIERELGFPRGTLNAQCFRMWGCTIHQRLQRIRVEHGLDLVRQGIKIEAASLTVGYASKKDFYRAVRLETGTTPRKAHLRN